MGNTDGNIRNKRDLIDHMRRTYTWMRWILVITGVFLPILLWLGGLYIEKQNAKPKAAVERATFFGKESDFMPLSSMSQYYWAEAETTDGGFGDPKAKTLRDLFVGGLFIIGALLICYRTDSIPETINYSIGGLAAYVVALIPTDKNDFIWNHPHFIAAVILLFSIALSATVFSRATARGLQNPRDQSFYKIIYTIIGVAMITIPVLTGILTHDNGTHIFWIECACIWIFAAFWIVKSFEIKKPRQDEREMIA